MSRKRRYGFAKPHLVALFSLVDGFGFTLAAIARALRPSSHSISPHRILLINFAHIGDALMITPALRAIRAAHPEAHITVLVGPWSKDLLLADPYVDEVMVFHPSWWDRDKGSYLRPLELLGLVRLLRKGQFDLSVNFKSFFQENLALWLARISVRVGYGIYGGGFFLTHQVEYNWSAHTVELNMALIDRDPIAGNARLGVPIGRQLEPVAPTNSTAVRDARRGSLYLPGPARPPQRESIRLSWDGPLRASQQAETAQPSNTATEYLNRRNTPEMFVFEEDIQAADAFLEAELDPRPAVEAPASQPLTRSAQPLFAFHIGAGYPSKLWGEEKYAALANKMASKWAARIMVVGGIDDAPLITRMRHLSEDKLIVAAGRLNIRQTAALISRCHLFVGNDSGPAHIAAAIGVPAVVLFSGENEARVWRPYADNCLIIQRHPECSPCGKRKCDRDHSCMEAITVEEVLDAVERVLGRTNSLFKQ